MVGITLEDKGGRDTTHGEPSEPEAGLTPGKERKEERRLIGDLFEKSLNEV